MIKKGEKRLLEEDKALEAEQVRETEQATEIQKQLDVMLKSKLENDNKDREQVGQAFDSWQDKSSKGIADSLLKLKMNASSQLTDNISKFEFGLEVKKRRLLEIKNKRAEIQRDLKELRLNEQAQNAGEKITEFIKRHLDLKGFVDVDLKQAVMACEDPKWSERLEKLGFPRSYLVVGSSFLKMEKLGSLSPQGLAVDIAGLRGYGPALLEKDKALQADQPLFRNGYFGKE